MRARTLTLAGVAVIVAVLLATLAGSGLAATRAPARPAAGHAAIKIGLVTDIGGLNDRGFNHLAYVGLQRAAKQLGATTRVLESHQNSDYIPNLSTLAQDNYDVVVGVGFLMTEAVNTMATKFPKVKFAGVDISINDLKDKPSNFTGLKFKENEGGYLVGYLSGLFIKAHPIDGQQKIGSVGGQKLPAVDSYIAGYDAGAKAANPKVQTVNAYSQTFIDPAACKELALQQIAAGAGIVFQVAGACGLGVLDAAKEKKVWGIGVDADQGYINGNVLTSALKRVDNAVFTAGQLAKAGTLKGGIDLTFNVKNGGVALGKVNKIVPKTMLAKVNAVVAKIKAGKIKNIPSTVK